MGVTGAMPLTPGVNPVDAGTLGAGVIVVVGSWCAAAALTTVAMDSKGMFGMFGSGRLGSPVGFGCWRCSVDWCDWGLGVLGEPCEEVCGEAVPPGELALGEPLPETRFDKVGFMGCGAATAGAVGAPAPLGDSMVMAGVARGISGRAFGVTSGLCPWLYAATCAVGFGRSVVGLVGMLV
ncbi:hypothetical protein [Mycobacteroides abscessus]|uniref:hypothetical protein n=1 Tax=Mycobacteroides abscessus TaxID=36809 RepID=UPI001F37C90C|nr:hypothetical protein [Mycobacteroides abscessus]